MKAAQHSEHVNEPDWYEFSLKTLGDLMADLKGKLLDIGNHVVECLDRNPRIREMWMKDLPSLSPMLLDVFERIGRKQILPEIYLSPVADKLLMAPVSVQQDVVNRGVLVVEMAGKEARANYKQLNQLTPRDAAQALKHGNTRSYEEQVEYLTPGPKIVRKRWEPMDDFNIAINYSTVITPAEYCAWAEKYEAAQSKQLEAHLKANQGRKN